MSNIPVTILTALYYAVFILIFARIIVSWVNISSYNWYQIRALVFRLTEPMLAPIRRFMPATGGFDLSPVILLLLTSFIYNFLVDLIS